VSERFRVYLGPLEFSRLKTLDSNLADVVDFGWFGFFGRMLLSLLRLLESFMHNWGLAIIGLTFIVKLLFFPLTQMSFKSSQAMQAIQPQLQEIREKFADTPEELNRRTIELFREAGVNPLGGCLPMLVQMPIWIALYNVLMSSVELYQTRFLYLLDLTSPDPYGVLPLVVVVLMVVQQRMMPTGNMDPAQQKIMQIMPILFGFFFFTSPSGLVVYIFVNMVLTILQQWLIKRTYGVATMPA
jgi:YidC/Oxa1 family membrane protein insertase